MKNSKVKAYQVPSSSREGSRFEELDETDLFLSQTKQNSGDRQKRYIALGLDKVDKRFSKLSDVIAQSEHWVRNEPIPHGLDLFPANSSLWQMRYSDLFYAYAKGGPLYIDTPGSATEIMWCEQKLHAYRAKGIRYTYIKAGEDSIDVLLRLDPISVPKGGVTA